MSCLFIEGYSEIKGEVKVSGFKNAALPILYSTMLTDGVSVISNVPDISDVRASIEILKSLGVIIEQISKNSYEIDTRHAEFSDVPSELVRSMRGSYYLLGAELGRFHRAKIGEIGGCNFGVRPIDQHIKAFKALGASVNRSPCNFVMCSEKLTSNRIDFDVVSVGATVNAILASVLAEGTTVLSNAAKEPHVVDLCNFLVKCGAKIYGYGSDKIIIDGVKTLGGAEYSVMPDMIEAGTIISLGAGAASELTVSGIKESYLYCFLNDFRKMAVDFEVSDEKVTVRKSQIHKHNIITSPYPGFPTDMQPQSAVLLSLCQGESVIFDGVWQNRYMYVKEARKLGASTLVMNDGLHILGRCEPYSNRVTVTDLRAGAALILAAIFSEKPCTIDSFELIERGYEDICTKLNSIGVICRKYD